MKRILALALSIITLPAAAHAARLATDPVYAFGPTNIMTCNIHYLGPSTTNIPVLVTIKNGAEVRRQLRTTVSKLGPAQSVAALCHAGRPGCENVVCIFSFTGTPSEFRGSGCAHPDDSASAQGSTVCMPAR